VTSDRLTPPVQRAADGRGATPRREFVLLPETGHMVPLERPAELTEALVGLAGSVGLSGASHPSGSALPRLTGTAAVAFLLRRVRLAERPDFRGLRSRICVITTQL